MRKKVWGRVARRSSVRPLAAVLYRPEHACDRALGVEERDVAARGDHRRWRVGPHVVPDARKGRGLGRLLPFDDLVDKMGEMGEQLLEVRRVPGGGAERGWWVRRERELG